MGVEGEGKTFVVILKGKNRSRVGWINGDLRERQKDTVRFRCFVYFNLSFPRNLMTTRISNLREATMIERVMEGLE